MPRGRYIALEGIDGAGKTTTGRILVDLLSGRGLKCHWTHDPEPHGLGEMVLNLWPERHKLTNSVWPLLFAASSIDAQHRKGGHLDLLSDGIWIVTDRCALSTIANFLSEDQEDAGWLLALHRNYVVPDLIVFLDLDPAIAASRATLRDSELADYESLLAFSRRYVGAIRACQRLGWNIVSYRIKPEEGAEAIAASIQKLLDNYRLAPGH